jgi:hypothetical protein
MPANPLADADVPANLVPSAGMMNPETVKERRRAQKMMELRQYLVDAGVVEAVVKLMVGIQEQDYRPPEAPNLLKDFFGDYQDPLWDEIDEKRQTIAKTKRENDDLRERIKQLTSDVTAGERSADGKKLFATLVAKSPLAGTSPEAITGDILKAAIVGPKPKPPLEVEVPAEIARGTMAAFFAALSAEDAHLAFGRNLQHELEHGSAPPYGSPGDAQNEDLTNFLSALSSFCAAATAAEEPGDTS